MLIRDCWRQLCLSAGVTVELKKFSQLQIDKDVIEPLVNTYGVIKLWLENKTAFPILHDNRTSRERCLGERKILIPKCKTMAKWIEEVQLFMEAHNMNLIPKDQPRCWFVMPILSRD